MKYISTLVFSFILLSLSLTGYSQNQIEQHPGSQAVTAENGEEVLQQLKGHYQSRYNNNGRTVVATFPLDYDGVEATYAQANSQDYDRSLIKVNMRFPDDSVRNQRWVIQTYDTLIDYISNATFPFDSYELSQAEIRIDSLNFIYGHINNSGTNDTVVITIFDGSTLTSLAAGNGAHSSATPIWTDTIITNSSLTGPGAQPGTIALAVYSKPVGLTLPQGQTFAVQIDYFGPVNDPFYTYSGFRDECSANCVASPSLIESRFDANSVGLYIGAGGSTFTQNVFFDCDNNTMPTPGGCERWLLQNVIINPIVTVTSGVSNWSPELEEALSIFPNPATDEISVELEALQGDAVISIFDLNGQEVYRNAISNEGKVIERISVSEFAAGIYSLQITSDEGVASKKFQVK